MRESVRAAAIPLNAQPGDLQGNLAKIAEAASRAAAGGAQLALFPELSITGFIPNHPTGDHAQWLRAALRAARYAALPLTSPAIDSLTRIAAQSQILIAAGLLEDAGNLLHNTHLLIGPDGLLGAWRKLHIPMFEMPFYNGGSGLAVAETPLGRIGVNICFDALFPESTRLLACQNVEIVLFPFAADPPPGTVDAWADWALPPLKARCVENCVFGLAANYRGQVACVGVEQTFPGGAAAIGPRGETMAGPSSGEDMLLIDFRREVLLDARAQPDALFRFRRPELILMGTATRCTFSACHPDHKPNPTG
jgi:predicted amidohydrolase